MTAILGGLIAAVLWAGATLASSRSSRMLGSRVVIAWIMVVGVAVGLPIGLATGVPTDLPAEAPGYLFIAGICYAGGLYLAYTALTIGKVSIVAPIVATEGAIAALLAVALGDELALSAAIMLGVIVVGVVMSSIEPARPDVIAGDVEITADALEGPPTAEGEIMRAVATTGGEHTRRAALLAVAAAIVFGVGLAAVGKAAESVPPIWVALTTRMVGLVVVTLPLAVGGRLRMTRAALPLVVLSGTGEIIGSSFSAWGASENIAIAAILGSQFAAIAAVLAYILFGERLSRTQVVGVVLIVVGVTALAATVT
jgi:drug/metabolite transporter (DMT)-like permease